MSRYEIEGSVVDTTKATHVYASPSRPAGYGTVTERLHRSRKGRWYLVHDYSWCEDDRILDYAEWVSPEEAVRLLLAAGEDEDAIVCNHPDLSDAVSLVCE